MSSFNKEAFMRQAKAAQAAAPAGGGGFVKSNAHKLKISKELGGFLWAPAIDKPKETTFLGKSIRGIIHRGQFNLVQFTQDSNKPVCKSTSYFEPGSTQLSKGMWMVPFDKTISIKNYNPNGSKGMSCAECTESLRDGGCETRGFLEIVVYMVDGQKLPEPFLASIDLPLTSQIEYQNYLVQRVLGDYEASPDEVITQFDIQTAVSKQQQPYKKVVFTPMGRVEAAHLAIKSRVLGEVAGESTSTPSSSTPEPAPAPAQEAAALGGGDIEDLPF